ncbi:MAG: 4a-hydroxytetrahydrobiopterin dehydratase [Acidimicrobiia bacterium]
MSTDITEQQVEAFLAESPEWDREGPSITRTFAFADFNEAMGFVTRIALASEVADHHPDIDIRWNKVTCVLSTHEMNALTSRDLELARAFDSYVS